MTDQTQSLFDQARQLSAAERQKLAEMLLDTLEPDPGVEAAWGQEAHRRWDDHVKSGEAGMDAFEALAGARRQLNGDK